MKVLYSAKTDSPDGERPILTLLPAPDPPAHANDDQDRSLELAGSDFLLGC